MTAIAQVCDRGILLENGVVKADGPINQSIAKYLDNCKERTQLEDQFKDRSIVPTEIQIRSKSSELVSIGQHFEAEVELLAKKDISFQVALIVSDIMGSELFWLYPFNRDFTLKEGDKQRFLFSVEKLNLYPGNYWIGLWIGKGGWMDEFIYDRQLLRFTVTDNRSIQYFPNFKPASVKVFEDFSFEASPPR